jgi:hypothetical protein
MKCQKNERRLTFVQTWRVKLDRHVPHEVERLFDAAQMFLSVGADLVPRVS